MLERGIVQLPSFKLENIHRVETVKLTAVSTNLNKPEASRAVLSYQICILSVSLVGDLLNTLLTLKGFKRLHDLETNQADSRLSNLSCSLRIQTCSVQYKYTTAERWLRQRIHCANPAPAKLK